MTDQPDHYATLRVSPEATGREIARAYRALLRAHHPDTRPTLDDGDTTWAGDLEELHAIMQAYVVLSDPGKRAAYDRARSGLPAGVSGTPVEVRVHRHESSAGKGAANQNQPPISFGPPRWEPSPGTLRNPRSHS
ncbi:DnaJ domain-containing protein [Arthrobacter sp. yr096]|uniref:J domain-containing protein n=1 Tax=Arthrobacter sp. yr096 TaxID=1761750 RepID=UPI0008B3C831|nr:J domain-containing protein [Arthrobacter sp. yr096]SEI76206.1 DnaJ domain-containing protein [Arthrobacter sp. yr096]